MKTTSVALLASVSTAASAASGAGASAVERLAGLRRRLSWDKIAAYSPDSQVTDHCAIDLDQKDIEEQLALRTPESFEKAKRIYQQGGHSKSYAQVTLQRPLAGDVKKGAPIMGESADGVQVSGKAYDDYAEGQSVIRVQYATTNLQASYVNCQVGGLPEGQRNMAGCLRGPDGVLKIGEEEHSYTYSASLDNDNGRTIAGFSVKAGELMRYGSDNSGGFKMAGGGVTEDGVPIAGRGDCKGCPYHDHGYFYDYYGSDTYADDWILAAFLGKRTNFDNGNANFAEYGFEGREQAIKKGTAYMSIFMYAIRELEDALDHCDLESTNNDDSVHAWDKGVCFYTGALEGQDGRPEGALLHQLADERCADFHTCGADGTEPSGKSKLNYDLFGLFSMGSYQLATGDCPGARDTAGRIIDRMYIPLIQGALKYAYEIEKTGGTEKERAEGAAFAAAVLPRVHAASTSAAGIVYANLGVGAERTDFKAVKRAFESVYDDLGVACGDVGGLGFDAWKGEYYEGAEPCVQQVRAAETAATEKTVSNNTLAIVLGATLGGLFAIAAAMVLYMRSREIEGDPVFKGPTPELKEIA